MKVFYYLCFFLIACQTEKESPPQTNQIDLRGYEDQIDTLNIRIGTTGTIFYENGGLHSSYYVHSLDGTINEEIYNYPIPAIGKYNADTINDYLFERDDRYCLVCPNLSYQIVVIKLPNESHRNIISAQRQPDCLTTDSIK